MNYYQHHIGDFNNATRHLTRVERSIYRDLIDLYYDKETPVPTDVERTFRLVLAHSDEEKAAVVAVLAEFFTLTNEGYRQGRCDSEIERFYSKSEQARNAGKASAAKRLNGVSTTVERAFSEIPTTHNPLPMTHDPVGKSLPGKPASTRRTRYPPDFYPDDTGLENARAAGVSVDVELPSFKDHHISKGNTMADWQAAWRTWVTKSVQFSKGKTNGYVNGKDAGRKRAIVGLTGYDADAIQGVSQRVD